MRSDAEGYGSFVICTSRNQISSGVGAWVEVGFMAFMARSRMLSVWGVSGWE